MFHNATKSLAAADVMTTIIFVNLTASSIAVLATVPQQLWVSARNGGFQFSEWLAQLVLPKDIPTNVWVASLCFTICLLLINIGSSSALNAIFSLNTRDLMSNYLMTIGCTINRRLRGDPLPRARISLGRHGLLINIAVV